MTALVVAETRVLDSDAISVEKELPEMVDKRLCEKLVGKEVVKNTAAVCEDRTTIVGRPFVIED
jgi:hypothetical protein